MVFKEGDYIPGRLEELFQPSSREDIAIYEDLGGDEFVITDTATGITFFFSPDPPGQKMKHRLSKISVVAGGGIKIFGIDENGKYHEKADRFVEEISASASCEWHGDPDSEDINSPPYQICSFEDNGISGLRPSVSMKMAGCLPCDQLYKNLRRMREIRFQRLKSISENEDGARIVNWINKFGFWYKEDTGGYYLIYYDANEDGYAETLAVTSESDEGINNMVYLMRRESDPSAVVRIPKMMIQFVDLPSLDDGKLDRKFDTVIIPECWTRAVFADMVKVRTGKTNFCFPETTWGSMFYTSISYAPEIGAVLGGGIAAYSSGSPFGAFPGIKTGYKVGMGVMGLVEIGKLLHMNFLPSDPSRWPGDKY